MRHLRTFYARRCGVRDSCWRRARAADADEGGRGQRPRPPLGTALVHLCIQPIMAPQLHMLTLLHSRREALLAPAVRQLRSARCSRSRSERGPNCTHNRFVWQSSSSGHKDYQGHALAHVQRRTCYGLFDKPVASLASWLSSRHQLSCLRIGRLCTSRKASHHCLLASTPPAEIKSEVRRITLVPSKPTMPREARLCKRRRGAISLDGHSTSSWSPSQVKVIAPIVPDNRKRSVAPNLCVASSNVISCPSMVKTIHR